MSDRFEQTIRDWYDHSRTTNLEFLNLSENQNPKISDIYNNISCVYDKLILFAKISIKSFHQISQHLEKLEQRLEECEENIRKTQRETTKGLIQISSEIQGSKPHTKREILDLFKEISQQPKLAEEQTQKLGEFEEKLEKIKRGVEAIGKRESEPSNLEDSIGSLTKRLDSLSINGKAPSRVKQGPIYVFKDPNQIFKEEYEKETKKKK